MKSNLKEIRQTWSFEEGNKEKTIIEIEMFCEFCEKRSTWRWVEKE